MSNVNIYDETIKERVTEYLLTQPKPTKLGAATLPGGAAHPVESGCLTTGLGHKGSAFKKVGSNFRLVLLMSGDFFRYGVLGHYLWRFLHFEGNSGHIWRTCI